VKTLTIPPYELASYHIDFHQAQIETIRLGKLGTTPKQEKGQNCRSRKACRKRCQMLMKCSLDCHRCTTFVSFVLGSVLLGKELPSKGPGRCSCDRLNTVSREAVQKMLEIQLGPESIAFSYH